MGLRMLRLMLITSILGFSLGLGIDTFAQADPARVILDNMSPAERVGQLFIVSFLGNSLDEDDPIFDLVTQHHIAGVILSRNYENFDQAPDTVTGLKDLILELQDAKFQSSSAGDDPERIENILGQQPYIPLFIGLEYEGGQQGTLEILSSLSQFTSNMAIGATWDKELSFLSGELLGKELEALGFNFLIGPALDVLEDPQITESGDLGVRTFGGDPYWVSILGKSFINGLQSGGQGRIAIIASHFPGLGGSDRPIAEEVATVRKTLEELKQFDLAPFFAVTQDVEEAETEPVHGLLTSHIRYQGFQGNIRATTRPISLDPQAFALVMALEPLNQWRLAGGVTVSESLGSRAIRLFRDPSGTSFNAQLVARDAFLAGNDLLVLENFRDSKDPDEYTTVVNTLEFFRNKYDEDPLFAERVDEAVLRILQLKLKLYADEFNFANVIETRNDPEIIGSNSALSSRIAQSGATLISPTLAEIEDRVEGIPRIGERIVFLTDVRRVKQCSECELQPLISVDALERAILRLYGPGAAGQVGGWNLRSYTFADLTNYLGASPSEPSIFPLAAEEEIDEAIRFTDWLIFNMVDSRSIEYGADALQRFLDQRPDLAREKKIVVFSFGVPYGLDATEISKIDIFYSLYDTGPSFIDMAARLLFLEQTPPGASPVSVPGIAYDLIEITAPDPDQVIQIKIVTTEEDSAETEEPSGYMIGDSVTIETGVIVDANGNPVPDRTPVEFFVTSTAEGTVTTTIESTTTEGIARTLIRLEQAGLIMITAQAGSARVSETLQLDVQLDAPAQATIISPTPIPTTTSEPTITPDTVTPTPDTTEPGNALEGSFPSRVGSFVIGLLAVGIASAVGYYAADRTSARDKDLIRYIALPAILGLVAYNYLALSLPGSNSIIAELGGLGLFMVVLFGGAAGLLLAYVWSRYFTQ